MKQKMLLEVGVDGADLVYEGGAAVTVKRDLVQTSAEGKVRQTAQAVVVSMGELADVVFDVVETLSKEVASRKMENQGKITITFGVAGGANANLRIVGAKADAFITVQLELPAKASSPSA